MSPESGWPELPGFEDDELRRTLAANYGAGSDAGLPDDIRFLGGVVRLIRRRLAAATMHKTSAPAVFILSGGPPTSLPDDSLKRVPMLSNGLTALDSHIWFVGPAVNLGHGLEIPAWADDEVFASASSMSVGTRPTIIFEPRTASPEARFYPKGLDATDEYHYLRLGGTTVTMSDVLGVVEHVYRTQLVTPGAQSKVGKLWQNAGKFWVAENAEDIAQMYLRTGLAAAFPSCIIRGEQSQVSGRLDLEVEEPSDADRSVVIRHAILELKVLRGFGSGGAPYPAAKIKAWISEGVDQAEEYRVERGSRASALCCFDMRPKVTGERCFAHVRQNAQTANVTLRVWHIFASAKAYRAFQTTERRATRAASSSISPRQPRRA